MLEESYQKKIKTTNYKLVTISGSRSWHHNIDHPLNHKKIGAKKPFELVILQGGSGETDTKKERDIFAKEVKKNITKIKDGKIPPKRTENRLFICFAVPASSRIFFEKNIFCHACIYLQFFPEKRLLFLHLPTFF